MKYFNDCYTPDEVKQRYRQLARSLHPDKGGSKREFQQMQEEYDRVKITIRENRKRNTLPEYFTKNGDYEYHRKKVKYVGIYFNHYYKFVQDYGADILIDSNHRNLIFEKRKMI